MSLIKNPKFWLIRLQKRFIFADEEILPLWQTSYEQDCSYQSETLNVPTAF